MNSGSIVTVIGGSGFLGSHVADTLSTKGYKVRVFDLHTSPYLKAEQEMICGDIMDMDALTRAMEGASAVYNFAGVADLDEAHDDPIRTTELNVLGNTMALEAAYRNSVKRYIYASTVYVFSNSGSFYRCSKQAAEHFVEAYSDRYGLEYTILRYGSLYGRRSNEQNGIFRLLRQALLEKKVTYFGDGEAIREYIHVTDAAELSARILDPQYANRHLVLTGQERLRVRDLMLMIKEILPDEIQLEFATANPDSHYVTTPYAFQPKIGHKFTCNDYVDLGQGLLDCIAYIYGQIHSMDDQRDTDLDGK